MIEESGRVVAVVGSRIWVQTLRQSTCQSCSARQGCGQGALVEMSAGRADQLLLDNSLNAGVGDEVVIGIQEALMLRASLLVYLQPLLLMVLGAVLAGSWGVSEPWIMLAALGGLLTGFIISHRVQRQRAQNPDWCPQLLRVRGKVPSVCNESVQFVR